MRNYRQSGFLTIICIILLLTFADGKAEDASPEAVEYELISLFISDEYEAEFSLILINRETESWCLGGRLDILQEEWPKLKNETIDALIVNNRGTTCRLAERFRVPVDYKLVSEQEYIKVLQNGRNPSEGRVLMAGGASAGTGIESYASTNDAIEPDWDNFDRAFPDAQGYLTFSRIGFNPDRTQALVIFSNAYRCSGTRMKPAKRKIVYFKKRNDAWELVGISRNLDIMY
ncbi:MAG: hypothetical protein KAV42_11450 [Candidatus Krumholzibacteria bacterium]|nr:hypothetical protein [Candidatus Krumholzibacteria bacterium]